MRYAFMTFSTPDLSLADTLALANRLGYQGLEPRLGSNQAHGIELEANAEEREHIRQAAAAAGIEYCCLATSCTYADPNQHEEMVEHTRSCLQLAADIGAPRLRVFGGKITRGITRRDGFNQVVRSLRQVLDDAAKHDITLCLETHDDWCDPVHVAEIMDTVNHPNLGVNWDIMHPVMTAGESMESAYRTLKPWIRHCHVHDAQVIDGKRVLKPIGEGDVDHATAIRLLKDDAYQGWISGEWIGWTAPEEHLPRELNTLQKLAAEA